MMSILTSSYFRSDELSEMEKYRSITPTIYDKVKADICIQMALEQSGKTENKKEKEEVENENNSN